MVARTISITLPDELIEKVDQERGDVSRSRYFVRLIERSNKERRK